MPDTPKSNDPDQAKEAAPVSSSPPVSVLPLQSVPIHAVIPEGFPLTFANHASIQWTDNEVVFSFFQVAAPGGGLQEIKDMDHIVANPVSRIVFTPQGGRNFLALVLQTAVNMGVVKLDGEK